MTTGSLKFLAGLWLLGSFSTDALSVNNQLHRPRFASGALARRISSPLWTASSGDDGTLEGNSRIHNKPKRLTNKQRKRARLLRPIRMSTRSSENEDLTFNDSPRRVANNNTGKRKRRRKMNALATKLTRLMWKGMTLPFPMLRDLGMQFDNVSESQGVGFSVRECVFAIVGYLMAGILAFCVLFEKWSIVDALYFSVTTFTTVGYGDVVPSSLAGRAFTCIFGLGGVSFLGVAIATLGSNLISAEVEAVEMAERASRKRVMGMFEGMPSVLSKVRTLGKQKVKNTMDLEFKPIPWKKTLRSTFFKSVPAFTFLFAGGIVMGLLEGWEWPTSLYYSVVTAGTIGYGDMSPSTEQGRIWAIAFIPLAVASAGEVLGNVAATVVDRRQRHMYKFLMGRDVTLEHLMRMDADRNGQVSKREYVEFMLLEMGLVTQDQIHELHEQFERLDVTNTGYLDVEDLKLMAELRGANVTDGKGDEH